MDTAPMFSSPPRRPQQSSFVMREVSRSGGSREVSSRRRPEFRNLSDSSRASREAEQPWRKRFREQCMDRLSQARDNSFMLRRQLSHLSQSTGSEETCMPVDEVLSEEDICDVIRQEWVRFKAEMERESLEYGALDESIFEDVEDDYDSQLREYAEWEQYEQQLLAEEMMEADCVEAMAGLEDLEADF
ncbi:hypothetical protein GGI04_000619 [Coemansia thaxteri]|uniref:RPA-interacting protein N-terminal domain-containing protein n=1 Tax=Coemansia thaxteri TaxID=2663907 RepID=A0A9W8BG43_9FUNG|nr:hypothetical protein H4R26_005153 [Coemansia thaxteri]KAJ2009239.1 hypothetical protein GGI04_000619 [Coemansia thaxteri]KAJ2474173.1 hypothetical protein GGI02_000300 [Coemansia sp. RSA 2322]KAJ2479910.1 hypothetical protein EV174_003886 [Coemansia sp. RSA 2320]